MVKFNLYIVGRITEHSWDFQGVFSTEGNARNACRDESYFVGPCLLNEELPHETEEWPGIYFPLHKTRRE